MAKWAVLLQKNSGQNDLWEFGSVGPPPSLKDFCRVFFFKTNRPFLVWIFEEYEKLVGYMQGMIFLP